MTFLRTVVDLRFFVQSDPDYNTYLLYVVFSQDEKSSLVASTSKSKDKEQNLRSVCPNQPSEFTHVCKTTQWLLASGSNVKEFKDV